MSTFENKPVLLTTNTRNRRGRSNIDLITSHLKPAPITSTVPNPHIQLKDEVARGFWFILFTTAARAQTEEGEDTFLRQIDLTREIFPCDMCRADMEIYISQNPLTINYVCSIHNVRVGYFYWMWRFRNHVNRKQGKPEFPYEDAFHFYYKPRPTCGSCALIQTK